MKRFLSALVLVLAAGADVQAMETGKPFMTVYSAKETGGHFQNWSIIQDSSGVMYVGNGFGVMEFDGSSWRLILNSNRSFARSLAKDQEGRIYVGGGAELGYLEPDSLGNMRYVSLLKWIKERDRDFTAVNSIRATPDGIYFQSMERLFRFQRQKDEQSRSGRREAWTVKTWQAPGGFSYLFWNGQSLYIMQMSTGLMKLENDSLVLVPGSERFANQRISFILPFPGRPGVHLLATRTSGLYLWQNNVFTPFVTEVDETLRHASVGCGLVLPDGRFALGTQGDGCFIIDSRGAVTFHLTTSSGLTSNTISAVYLDRQKNLWLTGDGGTAILEYDSPLSQVVIPSGTTPTSFRQYRDVFYIACNNGIYFLDRDSQLRPVTGAFESPQCFQLQLIEDELFLAKGAGILLVADKKARKIWLPDDISLRINSLYPCRNDSREIIAGMSDGACILRYDPLLTNRLTFKRRIDGLHEYVVSIVEPEPGVFWLSTYDEGTIRLTKKGRDFSDALIERFGPEQNLPKGTVIAYYAANHLCFTTSQGVYRFDETWKKFEPDPLFAGVRLGGNPAEGVIAEDRSGNVWANLGSETVLLKKNPDGGYQQQKQLLARFGDEPVNAIFPENDGVVWFGVVNFAYRYVPRTLSSSIHPGTTLIRRVTLTNGAPIFNGAVSDRPLAAPELPFQANEVHFDFAMPSYVDPKANEFQSELEGFDRRWSDWSRESKRYYTNLPPGQYRFLVRARNISGQESAPAEYVFSILAPWYRTWPAYFGFILVSLIVIFGFVRLRTRHLQEKSKALEKVVRERTVEIQAQKDNVEQLSVIGRDITDNLSIKDIINTAYENVNTLMDASVFGIGLFNPDKQALVFPATREKGQSLEEFAVPLADDDRLAVWCFKNRKDVVINDYGGEYNKYIRQIKPPAAGENPESILYLPLQHKDKTVGVITAQSFNKNAYTDYHLNILRNLATYSAIALDNADAYRRVNELLSDLQATQEKLVTQSKLAALGALTAGIAHEIKNPLNFINNFAELTANLIGELRQVMDKHIAKLNPADRTAIEEILVTVQDNAGKIKEHGKRADSIVKSMLQHSRGKAGERQPTDINAMLEEDVNLAYHGMRAQDSNFNITIETELDPAVGRIEVVPQDISRVFLNIISNACYEAYRRKATAGGTFSPTLTVRSRKLKEGVEVRVRDNGNGVPAAVRDKLFTPFFTTKPTGQGTGLGLSISHDIIVHGHNGQISFESEEGQYTEFIIVLPRQ